MTKAVFIDKDGTLVIDVPYNVNPGKINFYKDAAESLALLKKHGYKLFIITNQPGIAKHYFDEGQLSEAFKAIQNTLAAKNARIDGIYYCPHNDDNTCNCRKPKPGLIQQAAVEYNINLANSWMIGDILNDIEAGNSAGCKSLLVDNGNETEWIINERRKPFNIVTTLSDAAKIIITTDQRMI